MVDSSFTMNVWHQENGWHWSLTGRGVTPRSGISETFNDAVEAVTNAVARARTMEVVG